MHARQLNSEGKTRTVLESIVPDSHNEMFHLAAKLINNSSRDIFLTGKAGTGKTTFLKYIRDTCPKQMAIVAPTGVAAINAGGVTIHSFFQLPLSMFIPSAKHVTGNENEAVNKHSLLARLRINSEKKKILQELELLIIDEISMVRCDTLDAIDTILRHVRRQPNERFGGVQVLFIGDMFQLPPVIKDQEWSILREYYESPYFFDSYVIKESPPVYIEFRKIYRQSEERFIKLLNQVRNNEMDEDGAEILESCLKPGFSAAKQDGYIILTTHNNRAKDINATELNNIDNPVFYFNADIEDDFPENAHPADEVLQLKLGAQVMFIRNDADRSKRYYNGKIGIVTGLEYDKIFVTCIGEREEIEVKKERWENIRYTLDSATRNVDPQVLGTFTQYPLRLAWAITIHKSQGLTFDKAVIDAGAAFAPGQVYVALSRCTNLAGMVLQSKIRPGSLMNDERIVRFSQNNMSENQLLAELDQASKDYQFTMLMMAFDFRITLDFVLEVQDYLENNRISFNEEAIDWIGQLAAKLAALEDVVEKFHLKLQEIFRSNRPEQQEILKERVNAAANYFINGIAQVLQFIQTSPSYTDSKQHAKEYNDSIKEAWAQLSLKKFLLEGFIDTIDAETFHTRRKNFRVPSFSVNAYAGSTKPQTQSAHPELQRQLRRLRDEICSKKDLPIYIVAGTKTIDEMATYLPQTSEELRQISGFGDAKVEKYGQQFLEVIQQYSKIHGLESRVQEKRAEKQKEKEKKPKKVKEEKEKVKKPDTKSETFRLYKEGLSVEQIAQSRGLATTTIEGHLAYFIETGELSVNDMLDSNTVSAIESLLKETNTAPITYVKDKMGDAVSYKDIKWVLASIKYSNR